MRDRIIWTDETGRVRLYGSVQDRPSIEAQLESARGYLGRSYERREDCARIVASVRIEQGRKLA